MKSKISFFSVSPAIIREDFRRFWAIPVLAFIGYFLFGLLPIIVNYGLITKNGGENAMVVGQLVDAMLSGRNPFLIVNMAWVPILSGLLIFSYLHRTGSADNGSFAAGDEKYSVRRALPVLCVVHDSSYHPDRHRASDHRFADLRSGQSDRRFSDSGSGRAAGSGDREKYLCQS